MQVLGSKPFRPHNSATRLTNRWVRRTALIFGIGALVFWIVHAYIRRNTYHVSVPPGETVAMTIEIPMQRALGPKSYAQRRGLPVRCTLSGNEVGGGIVPADPMTRRYRDLLGEVNQRLAALADTVVLVVSGIPFDLKSLSMKREEYQ